MFELTVKAHQGGAGSGPVYIAYFTEQEALSIIRAELEAAGLKLNDTPPDYTAFDSNTSRRYGLDLFDGEKGVAVAYLAMDAADEDWRWRWNDEKNTSVRIEREFRRKYEDIIIGVFYGQWERVGNGRPSWADQDWASELEYTVKEVTDETKAEAREILAERLAEQAQAFIRSLQRRGILEETEWEVD
jgi:hypothetical protein